MKTTRDILSELAGKPSILDKRGLLRKYDSALLRKILKTAYDPSLNFYIKKIVRYCHNEPTMSLDSAIDFLIDVLDARKITGNAAVDALAEVLSSLEPDDASVLEMIIARDLRCGVSEKIINSVWKDLIPTEEFLLACSKPNKIKYPAIAQTKYDGLRIHMNCKDDGSYERITRNGNRITDHGVFSDFANSSRGIKLDGEIVFVDSNFVILERKVSNGLANKAIRGTIDPNTAKRMVYVVWDIVDVSGKIPYQQRYEALKDHLRVHGTRNVTLADYYIVSDVAEVNALFKKKVGEGQEGLIVKNRDSKWEARRSSDIWKLKEVKDCDLRIVGWEFGSGKNKDRLGNIKCESEDGILKVDVGSGFSDEQRNIPEQFEGKVARIQFNALIKQKNSEFHSLYLPVFGGIREDKNLADTLEQISVL